MPGRRSGCEHAVKGDPSQGGRSPLDPEDTTTRIKIHIPTAEAEALAALCRRLAAWEGCSPPEARRRILRRGMRAVQATLNAAVDQQQEALRRR